MKISSKVFLLLLCIVHAAYFTGSMLLKTYMNNDSPEYITQAYNILHHGSLYAANWDNWPHLPEYYSMRPPLYALLVLCTLVVTNSPYVLLFVQSVISIFLWWQLRKVAIKYIPELSENRLHLFLILALLLNPVQLILCNSIFSEILFQCLLSLSFISFLFFLETRQLRFFLFYVLLTTLALLTKPVLVYYALVNIPVSVYVYFRLCKKKAVLVSSCLMPLVIVAMSFLNKMNTGYMHYSSSKVFNLWAYNTTNFLNMKYGNDSGFVYKTYIYTQSLSRPEFKDQYGFVDSACKNVLISNITSYVPYHVQGMINFFIAPGREFMNDYLGIKDLAPMSFIKEVNVNGWKGLINYLHSQSIILLGIHLVVTLWNILLLGGLVAFTFSKKIPIHIKFIALLIIIYFAGVSSLALGAARYKAAIYPILLYCNASWLAPYRKLHQ